MRLRLLVMLFLMTSCNIDRQVEENNFLRLGIMLQNAQKVIEFKKEVSSYAWETLMVIKSQQEVCLQGKREKERIRVRVVKRNSRECSFALQDRLIEFRNTFKKLFVLDKAKRKFIWQGKTFFLLSLKKEVKKKSLIVECGQRQQVACYRGNKYKKHINTSCSTQNESFFCAQSLHLYCRQGRLICL